MFLSPWELSWVTPGSGVTKPCSVLRVTVRETTPQGFICTQSRLLREEGQTLSGLDSRRPSRAAGHSAGDHGHFSFYKIQFSKTPSTHPGKARLLEEKGGHYANT